MECCPRTSSSQRTNPRQFYAWLFIWSNWRRMGVAFAALVWWICSLYPQPAGMPHAITPTQPYGISLMVSACVIGIANRVYSLRAPSCDDCFAPHGVPFTYFHEGGFAGGEGFVWSGVVGDTLLIFAIGVIIGWIWNRMSQRHSLAGSDGPRRSIL